MCEINRYKRRILILTNVGAGLYKFRKELLERLINEEFDVSFSCIWDEFVPLLEKLGCKYISTPFNRRGKNVISDIRLFIRYYAIIKVRKPDVVLTYTIKPNIYGGIASRIKKIPYIVNITGLGTELQNDNLIRKSIESMYRVSLKKPACVFFQNATNREYFIKNKLISEDIKTETVPGSGVNTDQFSYADYPNSDGANCFVYIARIMRDKGIQELLEAAKGVKALYPGTIFNLVGGYDENYKQLIKEYEDNNIIKYHGEQNDIREYIISCHAIIHPSYHEGLSNVLLEAAATGRPILATNVAGCRETFDEGISGFGVEVKSAESLRDTIVKFISLPHEQKAAMGIAARKKVEREFNRSFVVDKYFEAIMEAVKT